MSAQRIGIAIATRNRVGSLRRTLARLTALPGRPPIAVADNASDDGTAAAVAAEFPAVRLIALRRNLGAAARTLAADALGTTYVAFADDDSWWADDALPRAAALLDRRPAVGVIAARVLVGPERRLDPTCAEMAASPLPADGAPAARRVLGFVACGAVARRSAFLSVGGFHPRWGVGGEEGLLAIDLAAHGWATEYAGEVVAFHHPCPVRDPARRRAVQERNRIWLGWLRLPARHSAAVTWRSIGRAMRDGDCRRGAWEAFAGAGWVLRERRVVPPDVARDLRALRI